jgi:hypothetical protein
MIALAGGGAPSQPCFPGDNVDTLEMKAGAAVVCQRWSKTCWSFAEGKAGVAVPFADPPPLPAGDHAAEVRDDAGKLSVCRDTTCQPLGKNLVAAIAAARAKAKQAGTTCSLSATTDLKVVTLGDGATSLWTKPWNVAADKPLELKPPREYAGSHEAVPGGGDADAMDELLIARWASCAGPCAQSVIATTAGINKGKRFPAGNAIVLDDKRFVVVPSDADGTATLFERHTGKRLGQVVLTKGAIDTLAVRLDDSTVLAVLDGGAGDPVILERVVFPKDGRPSIGKVWATIPKCQ